MTKEDFFDMLNRVHNPEYYYATQKNKKKIKSTSSQSKRHTVSKGKGRVDRLRKRQWLGK